MSNVLSPMKPLSILCMSVLCVFTSASQAQLLNDFNEDGQVVITAFGDSITYGVGDGLAPGGYYELAPSPLAPSGYPKRVAELLGVLVDNQGVSGELLSESGVFRFPKAIQKRPSDIVLLMEGVNDATLQKSQTDFKHSFQKSVNVAIALGKLPVPMTLTPPCCGHAGTRPIARRFSDIIRERSEINDLQYIDIEKAWDLTCDSPECELYALPEGLHPNSVGYDVVAQTVMAALLGIDIFALDGAEKLEAALGLEKGTVLVAPEPPREQDEN